MCGCDKSNSRLPTIPIVSGGWAMCSNENRLWVPIDNPVMDGCAKWFESACNDVRNLEHGASIRLLESFDVNADTPQTVAAHIGAAKFRAACSNLLYWFGRYAEHRRRRRLAIQHKWQIETDSGPQMEHPALINHWNQNVCCCVCVCVLAEAFS